MYRIVFAREPLKVLKRMPRNTARLIRDKIVALAADPHGPNPQAKRMKGSEQYRLRVGDWRVIYDLDDTVRILAVIKIGARGDVYDD